MHLVLQELKVSPYYAYPYADLSERLAAQGKTSLLLFSYGSLMDENSAGRTLSSQALATRRPALGFGIKRVFDRDIPITPESRWGIPCSLKARGVLNVQPTASIAEFVNGVLIEVPLADIPALLDREEDYDLMPIVVADWEAVVKGELRFEIAYVLHTPAGDSLTNTDILPRPGYYELTRDAVAQYGPLFALLWENSTYLSDGKTPISTYEPFHNPCIEPS